MRGIVVSDATVQFVNLQSMHPAAALLKEGGQPVVPSPERSYFERNDTAMMKMMKAMAVKPMGDVDHDLVAMMVPHHQGEIDMALAVLRYGHNEKIRRFAQEIIVDQQQEIAAMRLAVGENLPPSTPSPTQLRSFAMSANMKTK